MNKNVIPPIGIDDKPVTLFIVKPFDFTLCHKLILFWYLSIEKQLFLNR